MRDKLIFDVGAHKGEDTEFYLKKGFSVVAIEAMPEFCSLLERRFKPSIDGGQLKVLNVAITETGGKTDFYIDKSVSVWGTTKPDWVSRNASLGAGKTTKISVKARTLADVIKEHGAPWYCKIDIEGNDLEALKSLADCPDLPQYISIESEKRDWSRLMDEFVTFNKLGYSRFKVVDQTLVPLQVSPNCDHTFEDGSSGLFGEELPGSWLALPEAVEAYRHIFRGYALNGDNGMFTAPLSMFHLLGGIQSRLARLRGFSAVRSPQVILPPAAWYDTHAALARE